MTKFEELREAYFHLERIKDREVSSRKESDAILRIVNAIQTSTSRDELFVNLFKQLKTSIKFTDFSVIQLSDQENCSQGFLLSSSRNEETSQLVTIPGFFVKKLKKNRVSNIFEIPEDKEIYSFLSSSNGKKYQSVLLSKFDVKDVSYVIILSSIFRGQYSAKDRILLEKISPIISQAFEKHKYLSEVISQNRITLFAQMSSGIAHEINNPLAILSGKLQVIQKLYKKKGQGSLDLIMGHVTDSLKVVARLNNIIEGMRSLARGGVPEKEDKISPLEIIQNSINLNSHLFTVNNVSIKINGEDNLLNRNFKTNATIISQVIVNLLNNSVYAVKEMKDKWIIIRLTKKENNFVFSIIDSGTGISSQDQMNLFHPFFSTKPVNDGTGLGLSVSKSLIENLGGTLNYISDMPNTQFDLEVPIEFPKESLT